MATEDLERRIRICTRCRLHLSRKNAVSGDGPYKTDIMFIGEAPGFNEDMQGKPFVGAAGNTLNELMRSAGIPREKVFITNIVKCRPPENRAPADDEIKACSEYLQQQISIIKPKLIVSLGRISAQGLLGKPVAISKVHGSLLDFKLGDVSCKLFLTYHPAAALYGAETRLKLQDDFAKLKRVLKFG
jgi:DNA polymerase